MSIQTVARLALTGAALLSFSLPTWSADAPAKAGTVAAAKKTTAKKAAPAEPALADLTPEQLDSAQRVLVGKNACEFNQNVDVAAVGAKPGYFQVAFKGKIYTMAPEPTTTGAVRLEDKKNGLVWIQIGSKSMLMNSKIGQRMVDDCVHPAQKA
ncbi:MAG: hypothetical protein ABI574_19395 [Burkholderiales bacterium]